MRLLIQHRSYYGYDEPTNIGPHTLRLHPASHAKANVETYTLACEQADRIQWTRDPYGNQVAQVTFEPGKTFDGYAIDVELTVEIRPVNPFDFFIDERVEEFDGFEYPEEYLRELRPFMAMDAPAMETGSKFKELLAQVPREGRTVDVVVEANRLVNQAVDYVIREEPGVWTPEETLDNGRGSCRDSGLLLVGILRELGFAARFVSGYLIQVKDEGMLPDLPKGLDHDVVDLHAWAECYLPGAGWVGLDATSGLLCSEGHVPLASAATPALAAPLYGSVRAADKVEFSMKVARLGHEASPTNPYSDEEWAGLKAAGKAVDDKLAAAGITVTMGGEPTFNAREDVDMPEWNGDALGPSKWTHGLQLVDELRDRLFPGGLVQHRMGKWYPGESMPRWALDTYGRKDGERIWADVDDAGWTASLSDAERFAKAFALRLGVGDKLVTAFEDPWHFLHEEAKVPTDQDPLVADLDDPEERRRLARVLNRGLRTPAGFVLPLVRQGQTWFSDTWEFRRGHLFLVPGESPLGLRLPLQSLLGTPWPIVVPEEAYEPDPRSKDPLDEDEEVHQAFIPVAPAGNANYGVHTALCVEFRGHLHDGRPELFVFLPPTETQQDWLDLVAMVDEIRQQLQVPVILEGYPPPRGNLLRRMSVTPDPGVLEVNIYPTSTSHEYVELMEEVYDAALHSGLHTEKYMLDGRQQGSGGGHHLTLGGTTPLRSLFVQRPDVLASLVTFIQHHPSLSYLFTGLFVGPTSQAPRVDEGRHEALYELEIALKRAFETHTNGETAPPWLGDLLFRHLLVDLTGNTHRAELSIDKLFDHQTPHGRQGIVEFRAFEMPPHPRMAMAQMLLVRALTAAFVERPYGQPLVRWGTRLHDQFLLPYYLWQDFEDVLGFLADAGIEMDSAVFKPFLDFRCPLVGHLDTRAVRLEVRNAIEPWNVLGEEQTTQGTARFVDSSLERVEIRTEGLVPERHAIVVNGRLLPLRETDTQGQYVAGVRFRAWAPPHSLHAHLGIHHPVHFDVYDRWADRSLGACAYHVWHPEGQGFVAPPLTRFEAAARRSQRFTRGGHTPFPVDPALGERHGDVPYTLDLRRYPGDRPMPEPTAEEKEQIREQRRKTEATRRERHREAAE